MATTLTSVTTSVSQSVPVTSSYCIKVQVPVSEKIEQVNGVALGVSAAVCFVVGGLIALTVVWWLFRKQYNKIEEKTSASGKTEKGDNASDKRRRSGNADHMNKSSLHDEENHERAPKELQPLILLTAATDDRTKYGLCDILGLTSESDTLIEVSRQDLESTVRLELGQHESRINAILLLVNALLQELLYAKRVSQRDLKEFLANACLIAHQAVVTNRQNLMIEEEALRKKIKNADYLDLELRSLRQKLAFRLNFELVQGVKENLRRDLTKAFELSEDEIDVAMKRLSDAMTRLDSLLAAETSKYITYLEEMRVQRINYIHMRLADLDDRPAEVENRKSALQAVLDTQKADGKLTDKILQAMAQQYASELKALVDKLELGFGTEYAAAVAKLREARQEIVMEHYRKQEKYLVAFFSSAKKLTSLKDTVEAFLEVRKSIQADFCEDLEQREAKILNAVKQGSDETWQREVDVIDGRMKESLRLKAQLSDRDLEKAYRFFLQELQKLQRIRHIEKRDYLQAMKARLSQVQQLSEEMQIVERRDQQALQETRDMLLATILQMQIGLTEESKKTIEKDHDEIIAVILSHLRVSKLYWQKLRDYRLNIKRKQLMELKRKLNELSADTSQSKKDVKLKQKQAQELEKRLKNEEDNVSKAVAEEDGIARNQIDMLTADAMSLHENQLAVVIGRLLSKQARKRAAPTASCDLTISKLEGQLLKFFDANDVRLSTVALDSVLQQYENEIGDLMSQLHGARERQLRVLMEKLDQRNLQRQREVQNRLQTEAARDWKLQRKQTNSALLTELSRFFFEQRYQRSLADLSNKTSVEKERTKEELFSDLDIELQKQLKEKRMSLYASLMAVAKLNNDDIARLVTTAVKEVGGDDQRAAVLIKELRSEVQRAKSDYDVIRAPSSTKQQRWPKTDQDYMSRTTPPLSSRAPARSSSFDRDSVNERSRSDIYSSEYASPKMQASRSRTNDFDDDDYMLQHSQPRLTPGKTDQVQRDRTDLVDTRGLTSTVPKLNQLKRERTDYSGDRWNQTYGISEDEIDSVPIHRPSVANSVTRPRSAVMRSKEI